MNTKLNCVNLKLKKEIKLPSNLEGIKLFNFNDEELNELEEIISSENFLNNEESETNSYLLKSLEEFEKISFNSEINPDNLMIIHINYIGNIPISMEKIGYKTLVSNGYSLINKNK